MLATLARRGHLALMGDQDAGSSGLFVDFFGKPASTFKSIALVALEYRAYITVGYAIRLPDDFEKHRWVRYEIGHADIIDVEEYTGPDAVREITQCFTNCARKGHRTCAGTIFLGPPPLEERSSKAAQAEPRPLADRRVGRGRPARSGTGRS